MINRKLKRNLSICLSMCLALSIVQGNKTISSEVKYSEDTMATSKYNKELKKKWY